jgi:hypothetical protein
MFERHSLYKKPMLIAAVLVLAGGIFVYLWGAALKSDNQQPPNETDPGLPYQATLSGEYTCLPHKDTKGPQTLECALGIKADEGAYYALDVQGKFDTGYYIDVPSGTRIQVTGDVVPIQAISSDQWQKYDIKGIMHVTSFTKL